jgi:neutral/alkaline ceramidase-like enzyme
VVVAVSIATAAAGADGRSPERLVAGAATVELHVPQGTPLGGYGAVARRLPFPDLLDWYPHAFWFRPHTGVRDRLAVRALVLGGGGERVVWVTADLIAVDRALTAALATRLGLDATDRAALIVSASHTHSGPGAFIDSAVMGLAAMDREDGDVRRAILDAMADAVRRAERGLRGARIGTVAVPGPPVTSARLDTPIDRELTVMRVVGDDGHPIAVVWSFAIHGTMLGPRNLELSGDVMGLATQRVEASLGVPALFVNGAVGDVSPRAHGATAMAAAASALSATVEAAARRADARDRTSPVIARGHLELPPARLGVRSCLGRWVPRAIRIPLGRVFPADATLIAVAAGDTAWVTVPGELQSSLGARIKRAVRPGVPAPFIAGVSDDYLGYFVARDDADRISYVTCASLYGREAGERLADAAAALLQRAHARAQPGAGGTARGAVTGAGGTR